MEHTGGLTANYRRLVGMAFIGFAVSSWGRDRVAAVPYIPANCNRKELTLFPPDGKALVVPLPRDLICVGFSADGRSVFAIDVTNPKGDQPILLRIEFNPTRVSAADTAVPTQGGRSPDGTWVADLDNHGRGKLVLRDAHDATQTKVFGRSGIMKPAWSPDSKYLVLEKWQWRCGFNLDVEVAETLVILDIIKRKRTEVQSSRCKVQFGVNGFLRSDINP